MNPTISGQGDRVFLVLVTWALTQAAQRGWLSTADIAVLAPALALAPALIIGWIKNRPGNIAADLATIAKDPSSPIQGVITTNTPEGRALAQSIPENTIQSAGTSQAADLVKSVQPAKAA